MEKEILFDSNKNLVLLKKDVKINNGSAIEILDKIELLFNNLNYTSITRVGTSLILKNGNIKHNGWFNNPLKWANTIKVLANTDKIQFDIEWSVENQIINNNTRSFIIQFLTKLISDTQNAEFLNDEYLTLANKTKSRGRKETLWLIFGAAIIGTLTLILSFLFESILLFLLGFSIGVTLLLNFYFKKTNKNNSQQFV